jgi:Ni/Co efflux regulator RcnB
MKKILLGAAALAMTFVGTAASAQGYGGYSGRDGGHYSRSYDRDGRAGRYDRHDNRGGWRRDSYRRQGGWRQGQVYPYYRQRDYVISDYRAYNLAPPRHGYRYYRSDNGDVVMAAIASGLIGAIIGGALSDNDRHDYGYYGR